MYLLSLPIYKHLANESISQLKTMLFLPPTGPAVSVIRVSVTSNKTEIQKIHVGRPPWFYPKNDFLRENWKTFFLIV